MKTANVNQSFQHATNTPSPPSEWSVDRKPEYNNANTAQVVLSPDIKTPPESPTKKSIPSTQKKTSIPEAIIPPPPPVEFVVQIPERVPPPPPSILGISKPPVVILCQ
jgi:hypothetical protein